MDISNSGIGVVGDVGRSNVTIVLRLTLVPIFSTLLTTLIGVTPSFAQSGADAVAIEEVLVSARRREESLDDLSLSATVLTDEELRIRMVYNIEDASQFVPNVTMTTSASEVARVVIRGIGGNADSRIPNGTSIYVDGVLVPSTFGAFMSTLDVERIEVLRGPQGTLFGKNTTGGAVNIVTRRPGSELGGDAVIRAGEFGQADARLSLNAPIIDDKLFVRGAVALESDDGYYREVTTGKGYQDRDLRALQSSLRWLADEEWTVDLSLQHAVQDRASRGGECVFLRRTRNNGDRHESGGGGDYETACNASQAVGDYRFISDIDGFTEIEQQSLVGTVRWAPVAALGRLADVNLTINTGLRARTYRNLRDLDLSSERLFSIGSFNYPTGASLGRETRSSSFEAVLQGAMLDGRLDVTLGYHYVEDSESPEGQDCAALYESIAGSGRSVPCTTPGGTYFETLPLNVTGRGPAPVGSQTTFENVSHGLFFQGTYALSDRTSLDLGGRWTTERREFRDIDWQPGNVLAGRTQIVNELSDVTVEQFEQGRERWQAFTPMASISRQLTVNGAGALDEGRVYVSYSEGFNSGGFNYGLPTAILGELHRYGPERARAFEAGFKSTWLDNRVRLHLAAFYTDYADKQVEIVAELGETLFPDDPFIAFIDNVADVEIYGIEAEAQWRASNGFALELAASSLRNRFSEYRSFDAELGVPLDLKNVAIDDLTPDYTLNVAVEQTVRLNNGATLVPRLTAYWQDDENFGITDPMPTDCAQPSYTKLDARLTWTHRDGDLQVALFGTNVDDERILHSCGDSGITARRIQLEPPARWGVELSLLFGR